ncbi:hypothetical protein [Mycolicibacterium sp.]|uniref:hypothetical protein n=1 Tax=Mycolicibacterium sp. TaxID=2320850 RepID=UPI003D10895F
MHPLGEMAPPGDRSHDLAWRLADALSPTLSAHDKHAVFVALGCRQYPQAIAEALRAATEARLPIPGTVVDDLTVWLRVRHRDGEGARISALLAQFTRRTATVTPHRSGSTGRPGQAST